MNKKQVFEFIITVFCFLVFIVGMKYAVEAIKVPTETFEIKRAE